MNMKHESRENQLETLFPTDKSLHSADRGFTSVAVNTCSKRRLYVSGN